MDLKIWEQIFLCKKFRIHLKQIPIYLDMKEFYGFYKVVDKFQYNKVNAAINILNEGLKIMSTVGTMGI